MHNASRPSCKYCQKNRLLQILERRSFKFSVTKVWPISFLEKKIKKSWLEFDFLQKRGGGQRSFGKFPKYDPLWSLHESFQIFLWKFIDGRILFDTVCFKKLIYGQHDIYHMLVFIKAIWSACTHCASPNGAMEIFTDISFDLTKIFLLIYRHCISPSEQTFNFGKNLEAFCRFLLL